MADERAEERPTNEVQEAIRDAARVASEMYGPDQHASISMAVLGALRALPVEQRMEAMGMVHVGWYGPPETGSATYAEGLPANASERQRPHQGALLMGAGEEPTKRTMRRFMCGCGRWVPVTSNKPYDGRVDLRSHRDPKTGEWCQTVSVKA